MVNIPGILGYIQPQAVSRVRTKTRAVSIPGGLRVLSIQGEGLREEVLVNSANGNGEDGFNPDFITESDSYGRYFRTSYYPMIQNRTELYLNGSQLRILEETIDSSSFSAEYDARIEYTTGEIELQSASLVDQGGQYYLANSSNSGDGYLSGITLLDENAPSEVWTIRCVNTLKDSYGTPIRGQASFVASGSVTGQLLDEYGQAYIWKSDSAAINNTILSFSIYNLSPNAVFQVGDRFSIEIQSGVLQRNDQLIARYIATADLNNPEAFTDPQKLFEKHGQPSETNTLSLGAQMAFENGATSVLAIQAKPPLPRRTSEIVLPVYNSTSGTSGASGNATAEDLIFYIDAPGKPDTDTSVLFFIIGTDGVETQIFPNKVNFYDSDITEAFSNYEQTESDALLMSEFMDPSQSGYMYSYTVVSDLKIEQAASDGSLTPIGTADSATFYSASASFTSESVGKQLDFHDTTTVNLGRYTIQSITDENTAVVIRDSGVFISETDLKWQLIPAQSTSASESQRILLTTDLALTIRKGLRVSYIDYRDADFFDAGWTDVLDVLETQNAQILVPLPTQTFSAIQQAFRVHVERMSSTYYKKERVLFTGAMENLSTANVLGTTLAAPEDIGILEGIQGDDAEEILDGNVEDLADYGIEDNFGDTYRVVYFYPDSIIKVINGTRTTIPGYYMAAAAGGWEAGEPNISQPLTYKTLVGFTILNTKIYKQDVLNQLGNAGITVVQPVTGGARVQHGKTTTQSGYPEEEEISIIFIRDYIAKTMRDSFSAFIGQPEDITFIPSLTSRALGLLNAFSSQNLITAYRNLSISRDEVEPRQYNVVVEVQTNYPINWIFVDISVGLF